MRRLVGFSLVFALMWGVLQLTGEAQTFLPARATICFGFLLLTAYLAGDLLAKLRLPKITGYILAGILFGPGVLEFIAEETLQELKLLDDLALTFIALAAGGELRLQALRERRRSIVLTVFFLTGMVFLGVAGFTVAARPLLGFLDGRSTVHVLAVAALLGTLAVARSPSSAIAIISECKAKGPFTDTVMGVTVVMDMLVIILFAVMVSLCQAMLEPGGGLDFELALLAVFEISGSIVAGLLLGLVIALYIKYIKAELLIFILGMPFMVAFFSRHFAQFLDQFYSISFHFEPMLICLTAGFFVQNFSPNGSLFLEKIDRGSLPVYVLFFSLTGAALNLGALTHTWFFALLLVAVRAVCIWISAYAGSRLANDPKPFRRASGFSFITQAGVSLGLASIVMRRFPEWGPTLATTIVAVISINQLIGPVAFKWALNAVGETRKTRNLNSKEH